ncbi:MAG: hypothetical protein ACRD8W_17915 [Nitrososphaeraceae archaeon]
MQKYFKRLYSFGLVEVELKIPFLSSYEANYKESNYGYDQGEGKSTMKEILRNISKYRHIHFRLFDRNCLSLVIISTANNIFGSQAVYNSVSG